jgi:hypothetical protein
MIGVIDLGNRGDVRFGGMGRRLGAARAVASRPPAAIEWE